MLRNSEGNARIRNFGGIRWGKFPVLHVGEGNVQGNVGIFYFVSGGEIE